jgi:hypothetical protein
MAASSYPEPRTQRRVFRVRKRDAGRARVMRAWHTCATRDECRGEDNTWIPIGSEAGFRCRQVSAHRDIAEGLTFANIPAVISGRPGAGELRRVARQIDCRFHKVKFSLKDGLENPAPHPRARLYAAALSYELWAS